MNKIVLKKSTSIVLLFICIGTMFSSCSKFLEIDPPNSQVSNELVFSSDATATSAVAGIYIDLMNGLSFADGNYLNSVTMLAGLSSDELINHDLDPLALEFQNNALSSANQNILGLWKSLYSIIYQANSVIDGLAKSQMVTSSTKNQLMGEALFIRAFAHFYLVNLFGKVPIINTISYSDNAKIARSEIPAVYDQILADLKLSGELVREEYPSEGRARPNKMVVAAMLARVYLYIEDWDSARKYATIVIDNPAYELETDLKNVFLAASLESVWSLPPVVPGYNSFDAYYFLSIDGLSYNKLTPNIVNSFEKDDKRLDAWVDSAETISGKVYYPKKYAIRESSIVEENSVFIRLAEIYLIRAEALTRLSQPELARADINAIRNRADLSDITTTDQDLIIDAVYHERQVELFSEWGHRWLDLKRSSRALKVLAPIKTGFNVNDLIYPIPQKEIALNSKLQPQNVGY